MDISAGIIPLEEQTTVSGSTLGFGNSNAVVSARLQAKIKTKNRPPEIKTAERKDQLVKAQGKEKTKALAVQREKDKQAEDGKQRIAELLERQQVLQSLQTTVTQTKKLKRENAAGFDAFHVTTQDQNQAQNQRQT